MIWTDALDAGDHIEPKEWPEKAEQTEPTVTGPTLADSEQGPNASAMATAHSSGSSLAGLYTSAAPSERHGALAGHQLGDYRLEALLGIGGMAEVYRASDVPLQRVVAVKVLAESFAADPSAVAQFHQEAQRVARLSHPHVVPIYHVGEAQVGERRVVFLVMPLLSESLRDRVSRAAPLPSAEAIRLILDAADGLGAAHRAGLVHCDVKPGNILLDADGRALLCDFGIALDLTRQDKPSTPNQDQAPPSFVAGTPAFMAPEQLRGAEVDQRADVYALGAVLYQLLTGHHPFAGETPLEIAAHALRDSISPPSALVSDREFPAALDRVLLTALARNPRDRFPTMDAFAAALRRAVAAQRPVSAPRRLRPIQRGQRAHNMGVLSDDRLPNMVVGGSPALQKRAVQAAGTVSARGVAGARGEDMRRSSRSLALAGVALVLAGMLGLTTMLHSPGDLGSTNHQSALTFGIPEVQASGPTPTSTPGPGSSSPTHPTPPPVNRKSAGHGQQPHQPKNPGHPKPAKPAKPAKPSTSAKPPKQDKSANASTAAKTTKPTTLATPAKPAKPANGSQPTHNGGNGKLSNP